MRSLCSLLSAWSGEKKSRPKFEVTNSLTYYKNYLYKMFNIRKATVAQISTLLMTLTYRMLPMTLNLPCPAAQFRSLEFWIYHFFLCFIDNHMCIPDILPGFYIFWALLKWRHLLCSLWRLSFSSQFSFIYRCCVQLLTFHNKHFS